MKSRALQVAAILLTLLGLGFRLLWKPPVPTGRFLIHIYEPWQYPPKDMDDPSRTAPATVLQFTADGQYIEHSCYVIDSGKGDLSVSPGDGHVVAVGTWMQQGTTLTARRRRVARTVLYVGPDLDPLCRPSTVEYDLAGREGVRDGKTIFRATNQLRAADWEVYVAEAKGSGASCSY